MEALNSYDRPRLNTRKIFLEECPDGLVGVFEGKIKEFNEITMRLTSKNLIAQGPEDYKWLILPAIDRIEKEERRFRQLKGQLMKFRQKLPEREQIDVGDVKNKIDVVEYIGQYTNLVRLGNKHRGLCPFHNEKTPSFYVDQNKGFYHCFGCGAGGDIIKFVMEKDKVSFIEALKLLNKY